MMPRPRVIGVRARAPARRHNRKIGTRSIRPPARTGRVTPQRLAVSREHGSKESKTASSSRRSGHARLPAVSGERGSKESKTASTRHESSRGHSGRGHWAHAQGHGDRAATHGSRGKVTQASHKSSRGHRGGGHWAHDEGRGGRGHSIIASACTGNMREAAIMGDSTLRQAMAGDRIQEVVDTPVAGGTAPRAMGTAAHHRRSHHHSNARSHRES